MFNKDIASEASLPRATWWLFGYIAFVSQILGTGFQMEASKLNQYPLYSISQYNGPFQWILVRKSSKSLQKPVLFFHESNNESTDERAAAHPNHKADLRH